MKKLFTLTFLCLMIGLTAVGQYQLSGKITNYSGEALPGATVQILNTFKGAVADVEGNFSIDDIKPGSHFIQVNFVGFQAIQKKVEVIDNLKMDFKLSGTVTELNQIIVTANKQLQNIQKTPIAMTALQSKQIEQLQINELVELNRVAANFKSYDDGGGSFQTLASRGIYSIDVTPAVGLYVDDVPFFNVIGFPTLFSDIERIEVLKGPQGTLYGRNALAGAINIITKRPTNTTNGYVRFGYGNLNQLNTSAGLSFPLVREKIYARVHGSFTRRDGYVNNLALDTDNLLGRETFSGGARLSFFPTERLQLTLHTNVEDRDVHAYALVGGFNFSGIRLDSMKENHPYEVNFDRQGKYRTRTNNSALKVKYDLPKITINSITALQIYKNDRDNDDFDFTPFDVQYVSGGNREQTTISQELRFNSSVKSKFKWIGGLYFYHVTSEDNSPVVNGTMSGNSVGEYMQITASETEQTGVSFFGQVDYQLTEKWGLLAGLRFETEKSELAVSRDHFQNGEPFEAPDNILITGSGPVPSPILNAQFSADERFEAVSPKIGATFKPSDRVFLFGHVTRGYRPGGLNSFVDNADDAKYNPEFSWNYEIGLKTSLLDNRLRANLTGFIISWRDQQLFTVIDINSFLFGVDNLGKSKSRGLELETEWVPVKGLSLIANIGYLSTEITDFEVIGFSGDLINNNGNRQGYSPEWNGNFAVNYDWQLNPSTTLFFSLDYTFQSEMFFDPENTVRQDAYGLLNGRAGVSYKRFELSLWGKNIADKVYYSYGYGIGGAAGFASYGLPQTYGFTSAIKF
ncbi:TonB-dependent receptor [Fulvivirgaceae bacterium BMA12]|uniref:TonB-dependent receptor n=1 Tax=Agaribacillus aureus TaxID=3051825 RepID=A0ABT8LK57_9BACT|nr:TonB-dependent receptor [Fulvivirgaceae bacterium BMA12]